MCVGGGVSLREMAEDKNTETSGLVHTCMYHNPQLFQFTVMKWFMDNEHVYCNYYGNSGIRGLGVGGLVNIAWPIYLGQQRKGEAGLEPPPSPLPASELSESLMTVMTRLWLSHPHPDPTPGRALPCLCSF